jgi:cytochrome P450
MAFAGIINTAYQTAWTIAQVANEPKFLCEFRHFPFSISHRLLILISNKLRDELDGKTVPEDGHTTYAEKLMRESSRLYSPIYAIRFVKNKPVEIDGYVVPKGDFVCGALTTINHNPEPWDEPMKVYWWMRASELTSDSFGSPTVIYYLVRPSHQ